MFAVYLLTLNHWVTPRGLTEIADVAGWSYGHDIYSPVTFIVLCPFRWLPAQIIPPALNLFSAILAALILWQLARSVSLLPHDRTDDQRQREQSEYSILTISTAWAPPLFAVLVCGFQMTFWEHATQATGEMIDLFMFSYVIRCLLEYRVTQREFWLIKFALVYGLGMANNVAMVAFFPAFLAAVIWIKGTSAFNPGFMSRTLLFGLLGFSLIFFPSIYTSLSQTLHADFGETMRTMFASDKRFLLHFPRSVILLMSLTSILPVFVIGIRWSSYFGDNSPVGILLAKSGFHVVHGVFLIVCLWVMLDCPISPRVLGFGLPFLALYYLTALSIGYFIGYFLLIFGTKIPRSRRSLNPLLQFTNNCVLLVMWVAILTTPAILIYRNFSVLKEDKVQFHWYQDYFNQIDGSLPPSGAVVLSDDTFRLYYLEAAASRRGQNSSHLFVDTKSLVTYPRYLSFLAERNPSYQISTTWTNIPPLAPSILGSIQILDHLSQAHELYYIHPSFGYFFEHFYLQPQGPVYRLKVYPENSWDAPPMTPAQIAENETFWQKTYADLLPPIAATMTNLTAKIQPEWWGDFLTLAHIRPEPNRFALLLGSYYSRGLNTWGVEIECAGKLDEAAKNFDCALEVNPLNVCAKLNQLFNKSLKAGEKQSIQPPKDIEERLGGRRGDLLNANGPIDEPNFRVDFASFLADGGNFRQAVQQLERASQVAPDNFRPRLELAQLLVYIQTYTNGLSHLLPYEHGFDEALQYTDDILKVAPTQPIALFLKGVALIQLQQYDNAIVPLSKLLTTETNNYAARLNRAIAYYKINNLDAAKADYTVITKVSPKAYQVYYGLGEIAYQQKDKAGAIKNYELYLSNAPTNTTESASVAERLKELKSSAP